MYDMIAPELYRVALYTLGNAQDAEDAVSETFVEAYKGIRNLRDESSFKRWMMTILSIRCKRRIGGYIKERKNVDIDEMLGSSGRSGRRFGSGARLGLGGNENPCVRRAGDRDAGHRSGLHHTRGFRNARDSAWNGQQQTASDPEKTS